MEHGTYTHYSEVCHPAITGLVKVQTLTKLDENFSQRELHILPIKAALEQQRKLLIREAMYIWGSHC